MLQFPGASPAPPSSLPAEPSAADPVAALLPRVASAVVRRWWLVILCGVAGLGLGVLVSAALPPKFAATATIVVDPIDLNLVQNALTPGQPSADAGVSVTETQARVIASDQVLRRVVERLRLRDDPAFYKRSFWRTGGTLEDVMLFLGASTADADADPSLVALDALRQAVTVRRAERTYVLDITVKAANPQTAARVANAIVAAYLEEKSSAHYDVASRASADLKGRLDQLLAAVRDAESKVSDFRDANNLVAAGGRLMADQQVTELTSQLSAAQARTAEARGRLDLASGTSQPEIMQSADARALRGQLADLTRNQADLAARVGANHPAMRQLLAQIASTRASLQTATERVTSVNRDEYERAAANQASVARALTQLRATMSQDAQAMVRLHELERDAQSRRSVYESFLSRARETGEQERLDTSNARIISTASAPRRRSFPPSPMLLLPGSLLLGLAGGVALAVLGGLPAPERRVPVSEPGRAMLLTPRRTGEAA